IVYIEYQDGFPHSVITCNMDGIGLDRWDFNLNLAWGEFMHYNSGFGGNIKSIAGPNFIESYKGGALWISDMIGFSEYKPVNCKMLKNPILLKKDGKTTIDPFKFSYQQVQD